jgi:hypothetical protein
MDEYQSLYGILGRMELQRVLLETEDYDYKLFRRYFVLKVMRNEGVGAPFYRGKKLGSPLQGLEGVGVDQGSFGEWGAAF